ncbi:MAG: hypothetical protein JO260_05660 [Acidobacteria bacterium]|nr:hypothetical protein [Acidobacteriota bacterium]
MPELEKIAPGDAVLLRYLLGALPVDEAEPVEEASIVDEDFAARLNALEQDLVDDYLRGELQRSNLAKFQSWYLSSPMRVQKVRAAKAFLKVVDGVLEEPPVKAVEPIAPSEANAAPALSIAPNFSYGASSSAKSPAGLQLEMFTGAWWMIAVAAAVLVLIVALGYVTNKNRQLRKEVAETKKQVELDDQTPATSDKNTGTGGLARAVENAATVTAFLPAPTRSASNIPKVDVPAGTGLVVLSLGLGSTDADNYRAQLMNPSTQKIVWKSGLLRPGSDGTYVSVAVPANVLRSQVYLTELTHDAVNGKPELLGTYPFRAEIK